MCLADALAAFSEEDPTPQQLAKVFQEAGLPLVVKDGQLIAPAGITSRAAELVGKHQTALIRILSVPAAPPAKE